MTNIHIDVSDTLYKKLDLNTLNIIVSEFIKYKQNSEEDELPVPSIKRQNELESPSPQFGRDRYDIARKDVDIQHVHMRDGNSQWEDEEGLLVQWKCTSDIHLIYAYIRHSRNYYFYLIEIYSVDAHKAYLNAQETLLEEANKFKERKLRELKDQKSA